MPCSRLRLYFPPPPHTSCCSLVQALASLLFCCGCRCCCCRVLGTRTCRRLPFLKEIYHLIYATPADVGLVPQLADVLQCDLLFVLRKDVSYLHVRFLPEEIIVPLILVAQIPEVLDKIFTSRGRWRFSRECLISTHLTDSGLARRWGGALGVMTTHRMIACLHAAAAAATTAMPPGAWSLVLPDIGFMQTALLQGLLLRRLLLVMIMMPILKLCSLINLLPMLLLLLLLLTLVSSFHRTLLPALLLHLPLGVPHQLCLLLLAPTGDPTFCRLCLELIDLLLMMIACTGDPLICCLRLQLSNLLLLLAHTGDPTFRGLCLQVNNGLTQARPLIAGRRPELDRRAAMHLLFQSDSIQVHVGPAHLLAIAVPVRHDSAVHQSLLAFRATAACCCAALRDALAHLCILLLTLQQHRRFDQSGVYAACLQHLPADAPLFEELEHHLSIRLL
mmetsp:Transcript_7290/g.17599  ORF Transcript_7290/g.17599 Transcript_7290/m.17599 type:complete len:447 (+) Transcript_7290:3396-4736(+)